MADIVFVIDQAIDLLAENATKTYRQAIAAGDDAAHEWRVRVLRGGAPVDLTGCSASMMVRREEDDTSVTVRQNAEIAGNTASVRLRPEVYALGGALLAVMRIADAGGHVITMAGLRLLGKSYTTDTISDPTGTIPSLDALLARYEEMLTATQDSRSATQDALQAAQQAQDAVGAAGDAVQQAQGALADAQAAVEAAGEAAALADAWARATATAQQLPAGSAPTVAVETGADGEKVLALGIPKGDRGETGATPRIGVQAVTGEPGSQAQAAISGTAEEPVITLTIPKGNTGDIGSLSINGKTPDAAGSVTLSAADVGAASVRFYSVSFPASGWAAQEGGGYAQQAAVEGITESMHGHVDVDMSAVTAENAADLQAAWAMIGRAESLDGALRLTAYADAPTVDITVNLEVIA